MSQFRQNPISKHWVLIAPNRAKRPEQFGSESVMNQQIPDNVESCPFCAGNESANREVARFPDNKNWQLRIIKNKFEALSHVPTSTNNKDFFVNASGAGDHEVIITRKHNEPVALQSVQTVELTLHVLRQHYLDLMEHKELAYAQIFHNHGRNAGASIIHPHYQLIAVPFVPSGVHDEIMGCYHYYQENKECIYCAIMREEKKQQERVIHETEDFMVIAPYASRSPFEMWILPKEHGASFEEITDSQITELAYVLKVTLGQLYAKLSDPSLNFYIHTMPFGHLKHTAHDKKAYHWHLTIFPRIAFWGGFEYATGIPINPVSPEDAAKFLK